MHTNDLPLRRQAANLSLSSPFLSSLCHPFSHGDRCRLLSWRPARILFRLLHLPACAPSREFGVNCSGRSRSGGRAERCGLLRALIGTMPSSAASSDANRGVVDGGGGGPRHRCQLDRSPRFRCGNDAIFPHAFLQLIEHALLRRLDVDERPSAPHHRKGLSPRVGLSSVHHHQRRETRGSAVSIGLRWRRGKGGKIGRVRCQRLRGKGWLSRSEWPALRTQ